jgi:UDP-glucuronate 4-epimerase
MVTKNKKILITGGAGFIGFHVAKFYLKKNFFVIIIDNLSNYYDIKLKNSRINTLIENHTNLIFYKKDITNFNVVDKIFLKHKPDIVINLAAQPGIRASIKNPKYVFKNNIEGFFNIIHLSTLYKVDHLIYASTSSVYGDSKKNIFKENDLINTPLQMYSASKISNEIIAFAYSNIHRIKTTGLRFFTVYGPYGRPDMAYYNFTDLIHKNKTIDLFNNGKHQRDFTYIDDIVQGIYKTSKYMPIYYNKNLKKTPHEILNLGKGEAIAIKKLILNIEELFNKKAKIIYKPHQKGDMIRTFSNIKKAKKLIHYNPKIKLELGITKFINWYKKYYQIK